jgi:hypothetical protein
MLYSYTLPSLWNSVCLVALWKFMTAWRFFLESGMESWLGWNHSTRTQRILQKLIHIFLTLDKCELNYLLLSIFAYNHQPIFQRVCMRPDLLFCFIKWIKCLWNNHSHSFNTCWITLHEKTWDDLWNSIKVFLRLGG